MKCEICGKRNAVVFVQQISGDARSEIRLCAECAQERGLGAEGDIAQSLAKLLASVPQTRGAEKPKEAKACPVCGTALDEARKNGNAGCPACWETFGAELLKKAYKDAAKRRHSGRLPARMEALRDALLELENARGRLRAALEAEDYETAAFCRDRIRELVQKGGGRA